MKVVQVVSYISVESSGPSYSVPGLCRGLFANNVDVELHTREPSNGLDVDFPLYLYPDGRWGAFLQRSPSMAIGLARACKTAQVIQANGVWMLPHVYPAWAVKGTSCKLVTAPRGTFAGWSLRRSRWKKLLFGYACQYAALRKTDMWHATSEKEYGEIRALGYRQPVAIVPIGMDLPDVRNLNTGVNGCRRADNQHRVVFFGRLHKVKAIDNLVLAWANLCNSKYYSKWDLVIAGPDGGVRSELETLIADRKIPRVSFAGEINGNAKYEFLADADIYVLPSLTENFGVTVAEALACGTPVIASQGTPWEGLEVEKAGRWIPIGVEPLTAALEEMMFLSDDERRKMGECGRQWIARDFSWKGIGYKMKLAYEWLLGQSGRPEWVRVD